MTARVLLLSAAAAAFWVVLGLPARQWMGDEALMHSGVAVLLCWIPGVLTLVIVGLLYAADSRTQALMALSAGAFRMMAVLLASLMLYTQVEAFRSAGFLFWVVGAYLFLLAVEVILLVRAFKANPTKTGSGV